jgi:hypothetical protein
MNSSIGDEAEKENQNNYQAVLNKKFYLAVSKKNFIRKLSKSENFTLNAFFMERLLNQNTYQTKQAKYRGITPIIINADGLLAT